MEFTKANYLGNKQRLAGYIMDKFPEGAKTLYDANASNGNEQNISARKAEGL